MAKFLILLLLLLLRINDVQASCYYTQSSGGLPVYSSIGANGDQTLGYCQQLACSIWPTIQGCPNTCQTETQTQTQSCPSGYNGTITQTNTKSCPSGAWSGWVTTSNTCVSTCQPVTQTQTLSCPAHYSGAITQTNTKTCPDNQWQGWVTTSNTCVQDPPTCQSSTDQKSESCGLHYTGQKTYTRQNTCTDPYGSPTQGAWSLTSNTCVQDPPSCKTTTESQNLQCQTGYTGLITQTRTSSCPDPYGQPIFAPWITTQDTCVKSISNPTNPVSPVSPLNPSSPTAPQMTAPQVTAPAQIMNNPVANPVTNPVTVTAPTTQTNQTDQKPSPMEKKPLSTLGQVLLLEKNQVLKQNHNPFPTVTINQEIPLEIRQNNKFLMDILSSGSITESVRINQITKDTVEYEQ